MKEQDVAEKSAERDSHYFEICDMETKNHVEPGKFRLNSAPSSKQEIGVFDGEEYYIGVLQPGQTMVHVFRNFVQMKGTTDDTTQVAYIYVKREY